MMKKTLALLLTLMLAFSLSACGGAQEEAAVMEDPQGSIKEAEAAIATPAPETSEQLLELPVSIENKTGVDIYELYASGANLEEWGDDLLGGENYLPDQNSIDTVFTIGADALKWDLMMKDSGGNAVELYGLDFTECSTDGGTIVLEFDQASGEGTATLYSGAAEDAAADEQVLELPVSIENKTGVDIYELYASAQNLDEWGDDLLGGENYLPDQNSIDTVFTIGADALKWDLMMKDSEGNAVELYGLDFTECSTEGGSIVLEFNAESGEGTATLYSK